MLRHLLLVGLAGCTLDSPTFDGGLDLNFGFPSATGGTLGEDGRLAFSYGEGCAPELFHVCGTDTGPILAGATALVDLSSDANLPALAFASSDPSVFEIAESSIGSVRVVAHQPGAADLVVTTGDGQPFERVRLTVEAATALAFTDPSPVLLVGHRASLPVLATNAFGAHLFGRGAIQLAAGSLLRHTGYDPDADLMFAGTDHFVLSGTAVGTVEITASLGALTAAVPVSIVDTSAVAQIAATIVGSASFQPETATGLSVRGAHCMPSVSAPFPTITSEHIEGIVPNPILPGEVVQVGAVDPDQHGALTVSCALNGVVGSVVVTL